MEQSDAEYDKENEVDDAGGGDNCVDKGYEEENEEGVYMYQDDKDGNNDNGCGDNSCVDEDYDVGDVEDLNM